MASRQILWYKSSASNPERHYWNFLLINEIRELTQIKEKLYEQLKPVVAEKSIDSGQIVGTGMYYELFCLETPINQVDFSRVYQAKVRWDRRLQPRKADVNWNDLIDKIVHDDI